MLQAWRGARCGSDERGGLRLIFSRWLSPPLARSLSLALTHPLPLALSGAVSQYGGAAAGHYAGSGGHYGGAYGGGAAAAGGGAAGWHAHSGGGPGAGSSGPHGSGSSAWVYDPLAPVDVGRLNSDYMHRQLPLLTGSSYTRKLSAA